MSKLCAIFNTDLKRMERLIRMKEDRETFSVRFPARCPCEITETPNGRVAVEGPTQEVMFVIGFIADQGEDFLIEAHSV